MKLSIPNLLDTSKLVVYALGLSRYAPRGANLVVGVLLIEIAKNFSIPIGVANQLNTTHSLLSLLTALTMGFLSIKFSMEILLLTGICLSIISVIGCYIAPNFESLFLTYSLNGIAWSLVYPMSVALVGEHIPKEKRADAMSKLFAIPPIITVFGSPIIGYIGDWRKALIFYALPIAVASFLLVKISIPKHETKPRKVELSSAFNKLVSNWSALSCLIYFLLTSVTWQIVGVLSISFLREHHQLSKELTSLIYSGFAISVFIGALSGGKIVNRFGRKRSTVFITLLYGIMAVLFVLVPDGYIAAGLGMIACLLSGLRQPAINSLTVEQIPDISGSVMSLSSASDSVGGMVGAAAASFLLLNFGWVAAGIFLGLSALLASVILEKFGIDPHK